MLVLHLCIRWMRDKYAPFILSKKGIVLVLMAFSGLLAAGIFGVTRVSAAFSASFGFQYHTIVATKHLVAVETTQKKGYVNLLPLYPICVLNMGRKGNRDGL